jgi:hypothetical protein
MYVYLQSEHGPDHDLYTVGFYRLDGKWEAESDHNSREEAAARVHYLNGENSGNVLIGVDTVKGLSESMTVLLLNIGKQTDGWYEAHDYLSRLEKAAIEQGVIL